MRLERARVPEPASKAALIAPDGRSSPKHQAPAAELDRGSAQLRSARASPGRSAGTDRYFVRTCPGLTEGLPKPAASPWGAAQCTSVPPAEARARAPDETAHGRRVTRPADPDRLSHQIDRRNSILPRRTDGIGQPKCGDMDTYPAKRSCLSNFVPRPDKVPEID